MSLYVNNQRNEWIYLENDVEIYFNLITTIIKGPAGQRNLAAWLQTALSVASGHLSAIWSTSWQERLYFLKANQKLNNVFPYNSPFKGHSRWIISPRPKQMSSDVQKAAGRCYSNLFLPRPLRDATLSHRGTNTDRGDRRVIVVLRSLWFRRRGAERNRQSDSRTIADFLFSLFTASRRHTQPTRAKWDASVSIRAPQLFQLF